MIKYTVCGSCDLTSIRPIKDKEDRHSIQHHYDAYKVGNCFSDHMIIQSDHMTSLL